MDEKTILKPGAILANPGEKFKNLAYIEAESFSEEKLEQEAKKNDYKRKEWTKKTFHYCNICLLIVLYVGIVSGSIVLFFHWVTPLGWHFLEDKQIDTIKNILFSALAVNFAKDFTKRTLEYPR